MKSVLVFLVLVIATVVGPLLLAGALSAVAGVGPIEMTILYVSCITGAVLTWRSFRRKETLATR